MSSKLHVVGNTVKIPDVSQISCHSENRNIVFIGKMNYAPNVLAVNYFADSVFPTLIDKYPDLHFIIVGAQPTDDVLKLKERANITVTGYVDSVEPYFQQATIVVAPMLTGAGIQNKIIQAMAYGCCVVTTSIGAEGINVQQGEIGIFNGSDEMINGMLCLMENPEMRRIMGVKAREYVINNLSEEIIAKQFWSFIHQKK